MTTNGHHHSRHVTTSTTTTATNGRTDGPGDGHTTHADMSKRVRHHHRSHHHHHVPNHLNVSGHHRNVNPNDGIVTSKYTISGFPDDDGHLPLEFFLI